jgi:hypothetical protein
MNRSVEVLQQELAVFPREMVNALDRRQGTQGTNTGRRKRWERPELLRVP